MTEAERLLTIAHEYYLWKRSEQKKALEDAAKAFEEYKKRVESQKEYQSE